MTAILALLVGAALAETPSGMPEPSATVPAETVAQTDPTPIVGPPAGPPLSGTALVEATRVVASQLRCPVCQGLSVADSPSESAVAMKREVERLVAQGYSEEQCLLYFETSYGEFIRLEPKVEGLNLLVWVGPGVLLLAGLGVIGWMRLGNRKPPAPKKPPPVDPALLPYVEQVYAVVGQGEA